MQAKLRERRSRARKQARAALQIGARTLERRGPGRVQGGKKPGKSKATGGWPKPWKNGRNRHAPPGQGKVVAVIQWARDVRLVGRLVRVSVLATALTMAGVFYPRIEAKIVEDWWPKIGPPVAAGIAALLSRSDAPAGREAPKRVQVAKRQAVIDVDLARLPHQPLDGGRGRDDPHARQKVTPVETRGFWVLVRIGGEDGERPQEGWVYGSFLKDGVSSR